MNKKIFYLIFAFAVTSAAAGVYEEKAQSGYSTQDQTETTTVQSTAKSTTVTQENKPDVATDNQPKNEATSDTDAIKDKTK